jgi:hypothetical protein
MIQEIKQNRANKARSVWCDFVDRFYLAGQSLKIGHDQIGSEALIRRRTGPIHDKRPDPPRRPKEISDLMNHLPPPTMRETPPIRNSTESP